MAVMAGLDQPRHLGGERNAFGRLGGCTSSFSLSLQLRSPAAVVLAEQTALRAVAGVGSLVRRSPRWIVQVVHVLQQAPHTIFVL
jgi:hypothetical protein